MLQPYLHLRQPHLHLRQPNSWSCLPTAFAMVAGTSVQHVLFYLGHDGSEIVHSGVGDPGCRRSFAINELILYMVENSWSVTPIMCRYLNGPRGSESTYETTINLDKIVELMKHYSGVVVGYMQRSGSSHAVAWDHKTQQYFCPSGTSHDDIAYGLVIESFLLCSPLPTPLNSSQV